MKKILNIVIASIAAIITVSCAKVEPFVANHDPAHRTFKVNVAQTKTAIDALNMNWVAGDQIKVFGYTAGEPASIGEAVFTIKSGVGTSTAVFEIKEGETLAEYDNYYAVYPSTRTVDTSKLPGSIQVAVASLEEHSIPAAGQYDPSYAIMAAVGDGDNLTFYHCMAYIKLQIPEDDITNVQLQFANNCTGKTSVSLNTSSKAVTVGSGSKTIKAVCAGGESFTKGNWYYLPTPARSNDPGTLTVTFKKSGGESYSVSTSSLSSTRLGVGKIYNIGCPVKVPAITASNVNIAQDVTGGDIDFTIVNPAGDGVISIAETGGKTNPADFVLNTTLITDHFEFTCDENTAADPRYFYVTLTYTYNSGANEVTKDVVITQDGSAKETHVWDFATYTDEQMTAITGLAANATGSAGQTWDFGDGLTMVTNSSSKWNKQTISEVNYKWVATGGSYGSGQKYFSFTTSHVGTVTVLYASGSSGARALTAKVGSSETTDSDNVSTSTSDLKTVTFASMAAGTVMLYSKDNNVRVFSISFLED